MWQTVRRNPGALIAAILLHLVLALLALTGVDWLDWGPEQVAAPQVVQATIVDFAALEAQTKRQDQARQDQAKAAREAERLLKQGRAPEAITAAEADLRRHPGSVRALKVLTRAHARSGDGGGAVARGWLRG